MANWSNPTLTSLYTDFVSEVKNRDVDLALGLDPATTSPTNIPTNAIRWNSASYKYEKWNGSAWGDLSSKYIFTAVEVSGATVPANGMYLSATNTLNFATATTASRLTIDASGNVNIDAGTFYVDAVNNRVGVGTTVPYAALEVQGTQQTHVAVSSQVGPITAYNTTNNADTAAVRTALSLMRAGKSGVSYGNQANFNIGRYSQANANANTQLTLRLANGVTNDPDNDIMTWLANGNVGVGTVSPAYTLDVAGSVLQVGNSTDAFVQYKSTAGNWHVGANSSNAYVFYSGTYGSGSERARIDSSGRLLVGTTSARTPLTHSPSLQVEGVGYEPSTISVIGNSNTSSGSYIFIGKSRGTAVGSNTIVQAEDEIGGLDFIATDGTQALRAARITAHVDGTPGTNDMPGRLLFYTTADGAASPTERARINNLGYMQGTVNGLGAGRIPAKQYYRLNTQYTGSNVNTAQSVFGVGVTLVGSTIYEFEALYLLSAVVTTSCNMRFLFGGTATINNIMYKGTGLGQAGALNTSDYNAGNGFYSRVASAATVTGTLLSAATVSYIIKGTVSINAGGTFIPQYQLTAAPGNAFITDIGSYFSIWPLAASGTAVNIGSWA